MSNTQQLSRTWALITGLKMYDKKQNSLIGGLIAGFEIRSVLNYLYGLGITPSDLEKMIQEYENEPCCPEMHY